MANTAVHSRLRQRVRQALHQEGVVVTSGPANDGALDLIACVSGRYVELDVKNGSARMSASQRLRTRRVRRADGLAYTIRSVVEARDMVHEVRAAIARGEL